MNARLRARLARRRPLPPPAAEARDHFAPIARRRPLPPPAAEARDHFAPIVRRTRVPLWRRVPRPVLVTIGLLAWTALFYAAYVGAFSIVFRGIR